MIVHQGMIEVSLDSSISHSYNAFKYEYDIVVVNQRLPNNPYLSHYPDDHQTRKKKGAVLSMFVCIVGLVDFIMT